MGGFFVDPGPTDDECCAPPFVPPPLLFREESYVSDILSFPRRAWNPDFTGLIVVAEFTQRDWRGAIRVDAPAEAGAAATRGEIGKLLDLAQRQRAERMAEIMAQDGGLQDYFLKLLMIDKSSHPATYDLIKVAERLSELLMVYYKAKFNRPRPYQIAPAVQPFMHLPGHPSYPSGHSLSAHLIALCTGSAVEHKPLQAALIALAARIGHNREIAGVHFESDTIAGQSIAEQAFEKVLVKCKTFGVMRDEARAEWRAAKEAAPPLLPE